MAFELDGIAVDGGGDGAVGGFGDVEDFREAKIGVAELLQVANQLVGVSAADAGVLGAEFIPSDAERFIEALAANGLEALCLRGAAFGGDEAKGLALSDPAAEAEGVGWKIRLHKRLTWPLKLQRFLGGAVLKLKAVINRRPLTLQRFGG